MCLRFITIEKIEKILKKRRDIALYYDKHFKRFKNLKPLQIKQRKLSSNHLYIVKIDLEKIKLNKNQIMSKLKAKGILTQVHYIPIVFHPYYKNKGYKINNLPNSVNYYDCALSIPIHLNLKTEEIKKIIKNLKIIVG